MKKSFLFLFNLFLISVQYSCAQPLQNKPALTHQDTLRGTITPERAWWNVLHYNIQVTPDYATKSISGSNTINFYDSGGYTMQIDLQEPMQLDSVRFAEENISFKRSGNVHWLYLRDSARKYKIAPGPKDITLYFHGTPREAKNPPWDGGWIWKRDERGRPWMSVAVQGLGASAWYPCKDHQSDEPDSGARVSVLVPDTLVAVANGKLVSKSALNGKTAYTWEVKNPINNYNIVPYIGKYVHFAEGYKGEKGALPMDYWVLDYNLEKAQKQFTQAVQTLQSFEYWFGPYPFYEDGFKLVESPHLGMEHQSAVAYGNKYQNGYLGQDLSGSGWGKKWDFIIVHEVGHEWFGNNITTKDIADMWVHEGFTSYSETLFTEYHFGKKAANEYVQGIRSKIANDIPVIGPYGVNMEGSSDMYYKGSNMLHTIRQVINDDVKFRNILRGLNKTFYHQTVTTQQIESYISQQSGKDFKKIFDQYLRTTQIPVLEIKEDAFRWTSVVDGFNMPVRLTNGTWIYPTTEWKKAKGLKDFKSLSADPNFYIQVKKS